MKNELSGVNVCWLLHAAAFHTKPVFVKLAEENGLTLMQLVTLLSIAPEKPLPMHSVSDFLVCDASNVTGLIERLVAHDLVVREEKPEDRRVKVIKLTSKGKSLRKKLLSQLVAQDSDYLSVLEPNEVIELRRLLIKFANASH